MASLEGKPLVQWVWEKAQRARRLDAVVVATDDERIVRTVRAFGGKAVMTSSRCASGTDRAWEAAKRTGAQIVVNIQGDEPLIQPSMIDRLVKGLLESRAEMATLRFPMKNSAGFTDPHVVKVVTDSEGWALYFSRSPIPTRKGKDTTPSVWYKHIGLYAYRRRLLEQFVRWSPSPLERTEGLEQLRALEHGVKIKVLNSLQESVGVDTPQDLKRVAKLLRKGTAPHA